MAELDIIRKKYAELLYKTNVPSRHDAEKDYSTLVGGDIPGTYCWEDIDYSDNTRGAWKATNHCKRILTILRGYGKKALSDKEFVKRISGAVKFWREHDFKNPNWWHNDIGTPMSFGDIGIMMYDALDDDALADISYLVGCGSLKVRPLGGYDDGDYTKLWAGANLIWGAMNSVRHALIIGDSDLLMESRKLCESEICIGKFEGIQNDGSFFQHGPMLYSGGYGRSYAKDIATLAYIFDGTAYQFPREKLGIFLVHILDGLRHMIQGRCLDWHCVGREYVRPESITVGNLKNTLMLLSKTADMPRHDEIADFCLELGGKKEYEDFTKYFDVAHFLSHRTSGLYIGARFGAPGRRCTEHCNDENILGKNLSYGTTTCIMKTGEEYYNIAPLWDYSRIPGTTSRTETDEQLREKTEWNDYRFPNDISGGASKGGKAIIYQLAQHDKVEALVCDFAFKGGFICLGCGVKDTSGKDEMLVTTIDQCLLCGDMFEDDTSFYHNGVCYRSLDGKKIHDSYPRVKGRWTRNNLGWSDESEISEEVLTLEIHHKKGTTSSYAYLICVEDQEPEVTVLRNDDKAQAILLEDGTVMAVVYEKTTILVGGNQKEFMPGIIIG